VTELAGCHREESIWERGGCSLLMPCTSTCVPDRGKRLGLGAGCVQSTVLGVSRARCWVCPEHGAGCVQNTVKNCAPVVNLHFEPILEPLAL